jgi:dethiobiotin synthetase
MLFSIYSSRSGMKSHVSLQYSLLKDICSWWVHQTPVNVQLRRPASPRMAQCSENRRIQVRSVVQQVSSWDIRLRILRNVLDVEGGEAENSMVIPW